MIGALAIVLAFGLTIADDASAMSYELSGVDFIEVGETDTFLLSYTGMPEDAEYVAKFIDSSGDSVPTAISSSSSSGSLNKGDSDYTKTITVTAPNEPGNYRLVVTILVDDEAVSNITAPLKVVEAITLSATLVNNDSAERALTIYFYINGEKIEDSKQDIVVPANGSEEVTFDYVVKNLSRETSFYIMADEETFGGQVSGLGPEYTHKFYSEQNNYTLIEAVAIIVLVIMAAIAIWIYRKPIKNYGKPKARR